MSATRTETSAEQQTLRLRLNAINELNAKTKHTRKIQYPETKEEQRQWQLEQMAGAFRIFAKLGFADGASGHISLRDPVEPHTFWINPYGTHFGMVKVSDMIRIDEKGNRVGGGDGPVNVAGFMIHSAIHQARPDINAACHLHSPYGRAWSTFGKSIEMLNQDSCMFYDDLSVYTNFGGVVFAAEEGRNIAAALGKNKNLIMQNHGLLTCGGTVAEAAGFFIALERACQAQLLVHGHFGAGQPSGKINIVGDEQAKYTKDGTGNEHIMYIQFLPEWEMIVKETNGDFLE